MPARLSIQGPRPLKRAASTRHQSGLMDELIGNVKTAATVSLLLIFAINFGSRTPWSTSAHHPSDRIWHFCAAKCQGLGAGRDGGQRGMPLSRGGNARKPSSEPSHWPPDDADRGRGDLHESSRREKLRWLIRTHSWGSPGSKNPLHGNRERPLAWTAPPKQQQLPPMKRGPIHHAMWWRNCLQSPPRQQRHATSRMETRQLQRNAQTPMAPSGTRQGTGTFLVSSSRYDSCWGIRSSAWHAWSNELTCFMQPIREQPRRNNVQPALEFTPSLHDGGTQHWTTTHTRVQRSYDSRSSLCFCFNSFSLCVQLGNYSRLLILDSNGSFPTLNARPGFPRAGRSRDILNVLFTL